MGMDEQIAAALAGRVAQREFVDNLAGSWAELTDSWENLTACAAGLARTAGDARSADRAQATVFSDLAQYLAPGGPWREEATKVSKQIDASTASIRTLQRRVLRETVNIGVIGLTHAGKSTLLRKLTGLTESHIPSNRFSSTTATPSRIFHLPTAGDGRAVLSLHTWESFRVEVLEPLHNLAKLAEPVPMSIAEFRGFRYGDGRERVPAGEAGAERYRRRLRIAQESLDSYENLLRGGTMDVALAELRPYIAYPADDDPRADVRPYHAVRSVDIFCEFPELESVRLGLVDLPGSGEAGLNVHARFLADLRNNTDLVFIVKRPEMAPVTDPDWDLAELADDAAAGVRRSDFAHQVINRDTNVPDEYYRKALGRARADGQQLGIDVRECDLSAEHAEVYHAVLSPVLSMLAERLAYMDRDAAGKVLSDLADIVGRMHTLADQLASWTEGRRTDLPNEEARLRSRAYELKNDLGLALERVCGEYDRLYASGAPIAELDQEIEKAARQMREWMAAGLGAGSTEEWLRKFRSAEAVNEVGRELDTRFNTVRQQLVAEFGEIDISLRRSVDRLWGEVADALRSQLTEAIVPTGTDHKAILRAISETARRREAKTIADATDQLLNLATDYGSIFLRVGRPVIREVKWKQEEPAQEKELGLGPAIIGGMVGAATGVAVSSAAGPVIGTTAGHIVGGAASGAASARARKWYQQQAANVPTETPAGGGSPIQVNAISGSSVSINSDVKPEPVSGEFAEASKWHARLMGTTERVTGQLETKFRAEAHQTLLVLAAAIDRFKETATSKPQVEREYEGLCRPELRQIWPDDFGGEAAKVAAELAALRQRAIDVAATGDRVAALALQASRL